MTPNDFETKLRAMMTEFMSHLDAENRTLCCERGQQILGEFADKWRSEAPASVDVVTPETVGNLGDGNGGDTNDGKTNDVADDDADAPTTSPIHRM